MGSGVAPALWPPETLNTGFRCQVPVVWADLHVRPRRAGTPALPVNWKRKALSVSEGKGNMVKPHGRLVPVGSTHYCASTSGLSTWWSTRGLEGSCDPGELFLRSASRLDAFSGYPVRTWLPGAAPGGTTGTLAVRPSRSSRTRDSSSQLSYAHHR
jgi:hypothetical protein